MQASQNFTRLAGALADAFTLYVPDRRGRGLSGEVGNAYSLQKECEDLEALLAKTDAHFVFGLSSGALIALEGALTLPGIRKVALYEPPIIVAGHASPMHWVARYDRELAQGHLAAAMVSVLKGTGDPDVFSSLPRFFLVPLMGFAIQSDAGNIQGDQVPIEKLIPTIHYDAQLPMPIETLDLKALKADVLLLGGTKSQAFLKAAMDALASRLPQAKRVQLAGVGHMAADDTGKPERVAVELQEFFSE